jgi:hypothetical protein
MVRGFMLEDMLGRADRQHVLGAEEQDGQEQPCWPVGKHFENTADLRR